MNKQRVRAHDRAKTVSHLASGAKHFEATASSHQSVADVDREEDFGTALWGRGRWDEAKWDSPGEPALVIATSDGRRYQALELASLVLAYWRTELGSGGHARCRSGRMLTIDRQLSGVG